MQNTPTDEAKATTQPPAGEHDQRAWFVRATQRIDAAIASAEGDIQDVWPTDPDDPIDEEYDHDYAASARVLLLIDDVNNEWFGVDFEDNDEGFGLAEDGTRSAQSVLCAALFPGQAAEVDEDEFGLDDWDGLLDQLDLSDEQRNHAEALFDRLFAAAERCAKKTFAKYSAQRVRDRGVERLDRDLAAAFEDDDAKLAAYLLTLDSASDKMQEDERERLSFLSQIDEFFSTFCAEAEADADSEEAALCREVLKRFGGAGGQALPALAAEVEAIVLRAETATPSAPARRVDSKNSAPGG